MGLLVQYVSPKEGVHPSKWGTDDIGGVYVWCYSNLMTPMTKATA